MEEERPSKIPRLDLGKGDERNSSFTKTTSFDDSIKAAQEVQDNESTPAAASVDAQLRAEQSNHYVPMGEGGANVSKDMDVDRSSSKWSQVEGQETARASAEEPETSAANGSTTIDPPTSKSQLKKMQRQQRWEEGKAERKAKRKEKVAAKKAQLRAERKASAPSPDQTEDESDKDEPGAATAPKPEKAAKRKAPQQAPPSFAVPVTIIFDCSFDDLMSEKEMKSLCSQLTRSYSDNRNSNYRVDLVVSSFGGRLKQRYETVLCNHHRGWKFIRFDEADYVSVAEAAAEKMRKQQYPAPDAVGAQGVVKGFLEAAQRAEDERHGEVVYLTSDSPNTLTRLSPHSTYIIGGLVDHNRHKGICYKRAMDRGINTAKLPVGDYLEMSSRFVLTTNHVAEIMLRWLVLGDWGQAFMQVMPKRKGGKLKNRYKDADAVHNMAGEGLVDDAADEGITKNAELEEATKSAELEEATRNAEHEGGTDGAADQGTSNAAE